MRRVVVSLDSSEFRQFSLTENIGEWSSKFRQIPPLADRNVYVCNGLAALRFTKLLIKTLPSTYNIGAVVERS